MWVAQQYELVSIAEYLGVMMVCKYFMEAQGYHNEKYTLYQDNKLTILLAKSVRMLAGKNSKHIGNLFFNHRQSGPRGIQDPAHGAVEKWVGIDTKQLQGMKFW